MSWLIDFVSRCSTATVQRRLSYAKHIDRETIEFFEEKDDVTMYAQIEGTDYYDTAITYNPQKDRSMTTALVRLDITVNMLRL